MLLSAFLEFLYTLVVQALGRNMRGVDQDNFRKPGGLSVPDPRTVSVGTVFNGGAAAAA